MIGRFVLLASIFLTSGIALAVDDVSVDKAVKGVLEFAADAKFGDPELTAPLAAMLPPQPSREAAEATLFKVFTPDMVESTRVAAEEGDARAQYRMGVYFESGVAPISPDPSRAVHWYRKAAEQGFAAARTRLGQALLASDLGLQRDVAAAAAQIRPAAESGYPPAQRFLADLLQEGAGVARDEAEAAAWYRKAADAGSRAAMARLGLKLVNGNGVPRSEKEGVEWLHKAADRDFKFARAVLCSYEYQGTHMPRDPAKAFQSCSSASEETLAQLVLAHMYLVGQGAVRDPARAAQWYRKAALKGNGEALSRLGDLYVAGMGLRRSAETGYLLKEMAVRRGNAKAMADREKIRALLTEAERSRADRLAGEWKPGMPLPAGAASP